MRKFLIRTGILVFLLAVAFWFFSGPDIPRAALEAKYASPPSQFLMLPDGARVHVRDRGRRDAPTLILLHGSNASLFTWEPWVTRLEDAFHVITFDMPGHGLTGAVPSGDYSQAGLVKFIGDVADALRLDTFAIGGNSMGGRMSAAFTEEHPARITHLILVDSGGLPGKQGGPMRFVWGLAGTPIVNWAVLRVAPRAVVIEGVNYAVAHKEIVTPAMIDSYWDLNHMEGTRAATIARFNSSSGGVKDRLAEIKAPTLILWGEEDRLIT